MIEQNPNQLQIETETEVRSESILPLEETNYLESDVSLSSISNLLPTYNDKLTINLLNNDEKQVEVKISEVNIEEEYQEDDLLESKNPDYLMIKLLKKVCTVQQPGSLTKNYLYQYNKAKRYNTYKILSLIFHILNYFFGTFYCIISRPIFLFTQNKLTIYINYYIPYTSYKLTRRHY
jgi:hypothetical protein